MTKKLQKRTLVRAVCLVLSKLLFALSLFGHAEAALKLTKQLKEPAINRVDEIRNKLLESDELHKDRDDPREVAQGYDWNNWGNWNNY